MLEAWLICLDYTTNESSVMNMQKLFRKKSMDIYFNRSVISSSRKTFYAKIVALSLMIDAINILKNLVRHLNHFLLPYISQTETLLSPLHSYFMFNFLCFAVDELPAFIFIIYNFSPIIFHPFYILP